MGMYRHKMPDREISKEMERANFWEAEADMWHQNYKEAANEIERMRKVLVEAEAELIYLRRHGKDGARWEANDSKDVWRGFAREALKEKE